MFGAENIAGLSTLLQESQEAQKPKNQEQNPNQATNSLTIVTRGQKVATAEEEKPKASSDIWGDTEIQNEADVRDLDDKRPSPRYEILYKQSVGTEDTFLGMSDITPSSHDCSHLCIKVHFPGSKLKDLDVDLKPNRIRAESKDLRLFTYLPVTVAADKGEAKFDSAKNVLTVTAPIIREWGA
jgi:dynein assembly factor 6, axonemal